jgi:hypothetical protein
MRATTIVRLIFLTVLASSSPAPAQSAPPNISSRTSPLPFVGNLDGHYLTLAIKGSALRGPRWDSAFGLSASYLRLREARVAALLGVSLSATRLSSARAGVVSVEAVIGTRALGPLAGIGGGPSARITDLAHPRWGGVATVWIFAGIVPYLRVGVHRQEDAYIEVGAQLTLPIFRL